MTAAFLTSPGPTAPFEFTTAGRVVFGAGRAGELPALVAAAGNRTMICTGSRPERHRDLIADLPGDCAVHPVCGEPTVETVRSATEAARAHGADLIVAVGGGSVLDLGKAVAALLGNGGDPLDYLEVVGRGQRLAGPAAPFLAVPTTAGTGSEVTANAVLAVPERRLKVSMRSPLMIPQVALVDPVLTLDCPRPITAASGLDALTQCLEPFVSVKANPLTDALAAEGLRRAASGLRRAYADGSDLAARSDMALCGLLSGMALANAKLGAVHGLAGVIGGYTEAPHGAVCAALLAPVVEANVRALRSRQPGSPALARYARVAHLLTGQPEATVEDGVGWIRQTVALLDVPGLGSLGLEASDSDAVVSAARTASSMQGNPIALDPAELHAILAQAS